MVGWFGESGLCISHLMLCLDRRDVKLLHFCTLIRHVELLGSVGRSGARWRPAYSLSSESMDAREGRYATSVQFSRSNNRTLFITSAHSTLCARGTALPVTTNDMMACTTSRMPVAKPRATMRRSTTVRVAAAAWTSVALTKDALVAAGTTVVEVGDQKILFAAVDGEVFAVSNKCSHLGLPLIGKTSFFQGQVSGSTLRLGLLPCSAPSKLHTPAV
jgi:hypothetical protein